VANVAASVHGSLVSIGGRGGRECVGDTEELKALLERIPARTLAAKLRALMPVIESRIEAGVRHHEIAAVLNQNGGLSRRVTVKTLQCYLYRYRKAQRGTSPRAAPSRGREVAAAVAELPLPSPPIQPVRPLAVTPSMLRQVRNEAIDLELLSEVGKATLKKKGM
jgi:hypothetical protein